MLGKTRWLSTTLVVALMTIGFSASADPGTEQRFLSTINAERSAAGLASLTMDDGLRAHARNHTQDMIASGEIYHSTSAELQAAAGSDWSRLGENVGRGGDVPSLHQAFMDSPGHRANILGDYNYVGIGTATGSGQLWVTIVFKKSDTGGGGGSEGPTTTTQPQPQPTTATTLPTTTTTLPTTTSAPTTTTTAPLSTATTLANTTTTTLIVGPDKPVTPGESCIVATRYGWTCHD